MKLLIFIIVYPLIWILSILPMRLLYIISDFFRLVVFNFIGYRKKVVIQNLKMAFPDKNDKEIKSIAKKFYKHFIDLIFESIKSFTISKKQIEKRYVYKNIEVINNLAAKGRSIILSGSHQANWELSFGLPLKANLSCYGAYTRIQNPYFEKVIKSSRTKFGYDGVPTGLFNKKLEERVKNNIQSLYILLSDQSPQVHKTRYWATFLNNWVPVHTGMEVLAKKYNFAIVNMNITKVKRGYYEANFELITENPKEHDNFEITDKYLKITEDHILKQPEYYLWTHKRFKHKDKYEQWLENRKASQ
ncbi:lysophospholipid acyltransferase family protein [Tenacibaculum sp.]|uniref:lysophospholipid acyltransferase family protein n=1 Tax=Tenacibaculum sp. TaxID=1906242 RepID=UPI003D10FB6A